MRWRVCLAGLLTATAMASQEGGAVAQPRALLHADRADDVAVAGGDVLVAATTARGGVRLTAVPAAGGPARPLLVVRPPGRHDSTSMTRLASSAQLTALLVQFSDSDSAEWRVYAGPASGPLTIVHRVRLVRSPRLLWIPVEVDVHGDRLLIQELRLPLREGGRPRPASRVVVHAPGVAPTPVSQGPYTTPAALAGDRIAYGAGRKRRPALRIVNWRTGRLTGTVGLEPGSPHSEDRHLDLAADGRAVVELDGELFTGTAGERARPLPGTAGGPGLSEPRIAGERVAALANAHLGARQPVVIDPRGATSRRVGSPSTALTALAADENMVAWLANGCVLAAAVTDVAPLEVVSPGPCPRAEVVLDEHDQKLRGGSVRVQVACVAAPPSGCRGAVVLGFRGRAARGRFRVPAGGRQVVKVRLTRRGRAAVRRQLRLDGAVLFRMRARVADGRVSREAGTRWMLIDARP